MSFLLIGGQLEGQTRVFVTFVNSAKPLWDRVDVVQDETIEIRLSFQRLDYADVEQLPSVKRRLV